MATVTTTSIPTADIKPGMYFKTHGVLHLAIGPARPVEGATDARFIVPAFRTDGSRGNRTIYADIVQVYDKAPGTFRPSALRARARKLSVKAQELLHQAEMVRDVAAQIEQFESR